MKKGIIYFNEPFAVNVMTGETTNVVEADHVDIYGGVVSFIFAGDMLSTSYQSVKLIKWIDVIDKRQFNHPDSNIKEPNILV